MHSYDLFICDENERQIAAYRAMLSQSTLSVEYFTDARDALNKLAEIRPKILLIALEMNRLPVDIFLVEFSQMCIWDELEILISCPEELDKSQKFSLSSLGAAGFLTQPITLELIERKLQEHAKIAV